MNEDSVSVFGLSDRLLFPLAWALGYLFIEMCRGVFDGAAPAAAAALFIFGLTGLLLWYCAVKKPLRRSVLPLFIAAALTALSLLVYAETFMRWLNCLAAGGLLCVWAFSAGGLIPDRGRPWMLAKCLGLFYTLRYKNLTKPFSALASLFRGGDGKKTWLYVLAGAAAAVPLLILVLSLLSSADSVFAQLLERLGRALSGGWMNVAGRALLGLFIGLFIYSALFSLRRDSAAPDPEKPQARLAPAAANTVLLLVDIVYAAFVALQFAYLFGGAEQVNLTGLSYAEYARRGFFELVFVALINLGVSMLAIQLTRRGGAGWLAARLLSTLLIALTAVILVSAAYRMRMYVSVFALSILRALTIWGMCVIALWLAVAVVKIWRPETNFFRFVFASAVAAWLLLSCVNVNAAVARCNVDAYASGRVENIDVAYLRGLGVPALPALRKLETYARSAGDGGLRAEAAASADFLAGRAARECADWRSWSIEAAVLRGDGE